MTAPMSLGWDLSSTMLRCERAVRKYLFEALIAKLKT